MAFNQVVSQVDSILYNVRCYRDPQRVRVDVLELIRNIPTLVPRVGVLGTSTTQVLYLYGTIPIFYSGAQYNIPVTIWLTEMYPFQNPVPYVSPTPDMSIKPRHRHVDSAGMCYLPYLTNWSPATCNLIGLVSSMIKIFAQDPPVRSNAPPPNPSNYPNQSQPPYPSPYNPNPYQQLSSKPPAPTPSYTEDPAIVAKRNALKNLTEKLQIRLRELSKQCTEEIELETAKAASFEERSKALNDEKLRVVQEKVQLENEVENLTRNFEEITKWLDENDKSANIDMDAVTEPKDALSKQLLYLVAEDATIEDTLYYLEKKLIKGDLKLDAYLKTVRTLATEQFVKRATIKKIHERQRALAVGQ